MLIQRNLLSKWCLQVSAFVARRHTCAVAGSRGHHGLVQLGWGYPIFAGPARSVNVCGAAGDADARDGIRPSADGFAGVATHVLHLTTHHTHVPWCRRIRRVAQISR